MSRLDAQLRPADGPIAAKAAASWLFAHIPELLGGLDWSPPAETASDTEKLTFLGNVAQHVADAFESAKDLPGEARKKAFETGKDVASKGLALAKDVKKSVVDKGSSELEEMAQNVEKAYDKLLEVAKAAAVATVVVGGGSLVMAGIAAWIFYKLFMERR